MDCKSSKFPLWKYKDTESTILIRKRRLPLLLSPSPFSGEISDPFLRLFGTCHCRSNFVITGMSWTFPYINGGIVLHKPFARIFNIASSLYWNKNYLSRTQLDLNVILDKRTNLGQNTLNIIKNNGHFLIKLVLSISKDLEFNWVLWEGTLRSVVM